MRQLFVRNAAFFPAFVAILLSCAPPVAAAEEGGPKRKQTSTVRIQVSGEGKPLRGIGVFVKIEEPRWSDEDTTDSRGTVEFSQVPRGKALVQINEKEWRDFGKYYSLDEADVLISVSLEKRDAVKKKESE